MIGQGETRGAVTGPHRGPLPATARANVAKPDATSEVQAIDLGPPATDDGWLQVTASGICGTDVGLYARGVPEPTVLGHHVVGEIAALGSGAARRWQVEVGDRVAIEEYLPCGHCPTCRSGPYRLCPETDIWTGGRRIGTVPVSEKPSLFGGNAEYLYLPPNAVVHRLPATLPRELAAWVLPYANAIDWVSQAGAVRPGQTVTVLGPGYHGLSLVAAARRAGAGDIVIVGLPRDRERLEMAEALGAKPVVAGSPDVVESACLRETNHARPGAVFDAVGADPGILTAAAELLDQGGRLVLTAPKRPAEIAVDTAQMVRKNLTVTAVRGRAPEAIAQAVSSLDADESGLGVVPTTTVALDAVGDVLNRLMTGTGPESPHVVVRPDN